jgi:hypothetical protein
MSIMMVVITVVVLAGVALSVVANVPNVRSPDLSVAHKARMRLHCAAAQSAWAFFFVASVAFPGSPLFFMAAQFTCLGVMAAFLILEYFPPTKP